MRAKAEPRAGPGLGGEKGRDGRGPRGATAEVLDGQQSHVSAKPSENRTHLSTGLRPHCCIEYPLDHVLKNKKANPAHTRVQMHRQSVWQVTQHAGDSDTRGQTSASAPCCVTRRLHSSASRVRLLHDPESGLLAGSGPGAHASVQHHTGPHVSGLRLPVTLSLIHI